MFGRIPLWSHPVLDFGLLGVYYKFNFNIRDVCSDCLFFLDSALEDFMFLEIFPCLLGCPIYWHIPVHNFSHYFLYLYDIDYYFSSFISHFTWVLFFSWWAWLKIYQFYLPFPKKQLLVSLIFSIVFWSLFYLFPLSSLLFPSFCWLWALFFFF